MTSAFKPSACIMKLQRDPVLVPVKVINLPKSTYTGVKTHRCKNTCQGTCKYNPPVELQENWQYVDKQLISELMMVLGFWMI